MAKALIAASLAILLDVNASLGQGKRLAWQPADYHGVKVGKSTSSDLTRLFGKPQHSYNPEDEYDNPVLTLISYSYDNLAGFQGRTIFTMKKRDRIVFEIELDPSYKRRLDNTWMLSQFGNEYIKRIHVPCPTGREPRNNLDSSGATGEGFYLYPKKGFYVRIDSGYRVREIVYLTSCP